MKLKRLLVQNYKSLRKVKFEPDGFAALLGPNGAGKSNFADAIDFLSYVYRHGLEHAVARKGGYENIAFRQERRSKSAIVFQIEVEASKGDVGRLNRSPLLGKSAHKIESLSLIHLFSFKAVGTTIKSEFKVLEERITLRSEHCDSKSSSVLEETIIDRDVHGKLHFTINKTAVLAPLLDRVRYFIRDFSSEESPILAPEQLALGSPVLSSILFSTFIRPLAQMSVYKLSSELSRAAGVPTPNPLLAITGENLPAVIDWLKRHEPQSWKAVMETMRDISPQLEDISVQYLHTKTLGLFFKEKNVGRLWTAEDVSDGTIRSLAVLVTSVDPRASLLLIEEPENSVHPWIIKVLIERLRKVSEHKTVIVTSHSPVLIDVIAPKEAWVVYKHRGATALKHLPDMDADLESHWELGRYKLSEYLDSGAITEVVPGGLT